MTAFDKAWSVVKGDPKCKKCKKSMTPYSAGTWWCMDCPFEDGMPTQEYSSGDFAKELSEDDIKRLFQNARIVNPNTWYDDMPEGTPMYPCGVEVCEDSQPYGEGSVCDRCTDIAYSHGPGASKSSPEHDERICDYDDCMKPAVGVNAGEGSASWLCDEHWNEYF
tara:strand:+ start:1786 stop:2280 length:495 start_codon:yes stop_codon:yes gene_type:complete